MQIIHHSQELMISGRAQPMGAPWGPIVKHNCYKIAYYEYTE